MNNSTGNATVARARAIHGARLSDADYKELASKKSVSEVAEYLKKNTRYSAALSSVNTASVHRGYLESLIRRYSFERYLNICDFQKLRSEQFYNYLIVLSEIREILSIVLHINADSGSEYISSMPAYLINKTDINLIELARARSYDDLLRTLRNTRYYSILKKITSDEKGHVDYLNCEITLRTYYYDWLISTVKKSTLGADSEELLNLIRTQVDLINIINGYRMKKYYKLSGAEIEKRLLPVYRKLNAKTKEELFNHEDIEGFLNAFSKTYYGKKLSLDDHGRFETEIEILQGKMARKALAFSGSTALSVYALVFLLDLEVQNIITIIEGIRYKRSSESILDMIVPT